MKCITIVQGNEAFQVKIKALGCNVNVHVLSIDQKSLLYDETILFNQEHIAVNYKNEFNKSQAKQIIKRYIRYR